MNLVERAISPTPTFFQKLRNIGLALAAVSAAIIAAPVTLPTIVVTIAGYLAVAGTVLSGVSQITVPEDKA
jgi:ABC-type xylose transport system permease subunit